jgi:thiol-disulfide isomerase/thioredoxin
MKKILLLLASVTLLSCTNNEKTPANATSEETGASEQTATLEGATQIKQIDIALSGKDIFSSIINDHKGKPMLVDLWATWCPPCRAAMKSIIPIKEKMHGKVAFVYVTGPSSPADTWNNMIKDIHGDHYYVSEEQWNTLLNQFESQGIPTYIIVDSNGSITNTHIGFPGEELLQKELEDLIK